MPVSNCRCCGAPVEWNWEDAFFKFGFGDGDGLVMTEKVSDVLMSAGHVTNLVQWGFHNLVIQSITRGGIEQIPNEGIVFGYDDPRDYLPKAILDLLDEKLPAGETV